MSEVVVDVAGTAECDPPVRFDAGAVVRGPRSGPLPVAGAVPWAGRRTGSDSAMSPRDPALTSGVRRSGCSRPIRSTTLPDARGARQRRVSRPSRGRRRCHPERCGRRDSTRQLPRQHLSPTAPLGCFVIPNPWDVGPPAHSQCSGSPPRDHQRRVRLFAWPSRLAGHADAGRRPRAHRGHRGCDGAPGQRRLPGGVRGGPRAARCAHPAVHRDRRGRFSIEDTTGSPERRLFDRSEAVERIGAARRPSTTRVQTCSSPPRGGVFSRRSSRSALRVDPEAPGLCSGRRRRAVRPRRQAPRRHPSARRGVRPKPLNVLMSADTGVRVADLAELGVRRISVGSARRPPGRRSSTRPGPCRRGLLHRHRACDTLLRAERAVRPCMTTDRTGVHVEEPDGTAGSGDHRSGGGDDALGPALRHLTVSGLAHDLAGFLVIWVAIVSIGCSRTGSSRSDRWSRGPSSP